VDADDVLHWQGHASIVADDTAEILDAA
jgi:hypothetical protein